MWTRDAHAFCKAMALCVCACDRVCCFQWECSFAWILFVCSTWLYGLVCALCPFISASVYLPVVFHVIQSELGWMVVLIHSTNGGSIPMRVNEQTHCMALHVLHVVSFHLLIYKISFEQPCRTLQRGERLQGSGTPIVANIIQSSSQPEIRVTLRVGDPSVSAP